MNIEFRRKKYIHKTCIKQSLCYSLPKSKGEIHQTTRCMMITGYKSRFLMIDECCTLLLGSSDDACYICLRIVYFLNSWITRKYFSYSSLINEKYVNLQWGAFHTYQWGRKACLLYHWKYKKIINRPLGNKTIGKKIRFGSFILKDVFVVMNASVGHQTKKTTFVTTVKNRFK